MIDPVSIDEPGTQTLLTGLTLMQRPELGKPRLANLLKNRTAPLPAICRFLVCCSVALPVTAQMPPGVPAQYQAIYGNLTTQIGAFQNVVNQSWNGKPSPVTWSPHLSTAESDNYLKLIGSDYYNDTVLTELQEIQAAGAKGVTVHVNFPILYQPFYTYTNNPTGYSQFVAFYQQLVTDVHERGMKIVVEATVNEPLDGTDGAQFAPYYQTLDWTEYMTARAQNAVNIAQLIVPDYLSLICEPDSESNNASQPTENSPEGALQLLQTILAALQEAGVTNQTIGAGAGTWIAEFTSYIQEFATTPLNYIDLHVYPVNNNDFMNVLTGMTLIQQSGKAIGVSESWPEKIANSELGTLDISTIDSRYVFSFWSPIDIAFLQAMVDCTQYENAAFFSPSYPGFFAAYLDYNSFGTETPSELLPASFLASATANQQGIFTATGAAFSTMIAGVDTTPPATPPAPTATFTNSTVNLTWTPTTDNVGVAGYYVYRDGVEVSQIATAPFHDAGLTPGATYTYNLSAFDAQMNISEQSQPLSVTTVNTTPPTVPTDVVVTNVTQTTVSLSWSPSAVIGGVMGYRVWRGANPSAMQALGDVTTTSYVDPYAMASTAYYYSVEAYNASWVDSPLSASVSATTLGIPAPTGLTVIGVAQNSVTLSWSPLLVGGVTGYVVYRSIAPSTLSVRASTSTSNYADTLVAASATYTYFVVAVNANGTASPLSNPVSATTLALPSPTGLTVVNVTLNSVSLSWSPPLVGGITGYRVFRGPSPTTLAVLGAAATSSYVDLLAMPSTTYYFAVEAEDAYGITSGLSSPVSATTLEIPAPTGLTVVSVTQNSVSLTWSPSLIVGVTGYRVLKGISLTTMTVVAGVTTASYVDPYALPSTTHYYAVQAYNVLGNPSAPSTPVSATTLDLPPPMELIATDVTNTTVALSWNPSGGTDQPVGYTILKGTSASSLQIVVTSNPGTTYSDTDVAPNTTYYYQTEMRDALGLKSLPSNLLTVTTSP